MANRNYKETKTQLTSYTKNHYDRSLKMENKKMKIVVSGDICINMLQWVTYPMVNSSLNWQTHLNMHSALKPGESFTSIKACSFGNRSFCIFTADT